MQFLDWLFSLGKEKVTLEKCFTCEAEKHESRSKKDILFDLAKGYGLELEMLRLLEEAGTVTNRYWAIVDFRLHSVNKRLYVFDSQEAIAAEYYVAHGKNSDPNFKGQCVKFSNTPNSLCSSLGLYRCAEQYISTKFGKALRMDGLDKTNSNVRKRAIVFHGGKYAEDDYVRKNAKTGRSEGCLVVGFKYSSDLIDKLKNGSYILVIGDDKLNT